MARVNNNVSQLSQKLLEGWTLMAESCPQPSCNVPLVRHKPNKKTFCVSCEVYFDEHFERIGQPPAFAPHPHPPTQSSPDDTSQLSPTPMHVDPPVTSAAPSSPSTDTSPTPPSPSPSLPAPPRQAPPPRKTGDEQSGLLAEKLLQGWTLLNEYCPLDNCATPLVRSRRKRKFCVACSLYVVDPTEAAAAAEKAAAEKAAAEHKTASAMLPVGGPPAVAPRLQPPSPASVSQPLPERGMAAAGGGGGGSDQLGRVTHDCIAALTHKLAQHTAMLAQSGDLHTSKEVVWHIQQTATAIASLQALCKPACESH